MFLGQQHVKLEAKNRLAFPAKFREETGDSLIITYGFEQSLLVISQENWEELIREWKNESFLFREARDVELFLFGGATEVLLDKQGRFVLPPHLKDFAKIEKETVFIGARNYVRL